MAGQTNNEQILLGAAEDVAKRLGVQINQLNGLFASLTDFKKGISRDFVTLNDYNKRIMFGINDANKHLFNIQNMLSKSFANDAGNLQREDKFPLIIKRTFDKPNKDVAKLSSNLPKNAPEGKPQNKLQEQQSKPFETKLEQTKAPSIIVADFEPEALGKIASILPNAIKKGVKDLNKSIKDLSKTFKEGIDSTANASGGGGLLGGIIDLLMLKLGLKGLFGKGAVPPPLPAAGGAAAGGLSRGARALRGLKIGGPLAALFAGYDFMSRTGEGQTTTQAAIGTGAGVTGGIAGAALGQMLIPIPVVGAAIGGVVGSMSASWLADQLSGASRKETRVKGKQYTRDDREQQDKLENYVLSTRKYRTVQEFIQAVNRGDEKPIRWNSKTRQYEPYFDAPDKNKPSAELPPPTTPKEVKPPSATTPPSNSQDTPKTKQEVDRAIDEQLKKIEALGKDPQKNKTQIEEEFKKLKELENKLNEIQSKKTLSKPTATQAKAEIKQTAPQAKVESKPAAPQKTFVDEPEFQKFVENQNPGLIERQQARLNEQKEFRKTFVPLMSRNDEESLAKWEDDKKQSDLIADRVKQSTDELTKLYQEYTKLQQEQKATKTSERVTKDVKQADVDIANAKKEQAEIAKKLATASKTKIQDGVVSPKEGLRISTPFGQLFETHPRDVGVFAPEDAFKQLGKTLQNLKNPQNVDNNAIKEGVKEAKITNNKLDAMANNFSVLAKALQKMGVNVGEKMQNPVFINASSNQNREQKHAGTAQDLSNMSSSARMYTAYAQNLRPFAV